MSVTETRAPVLRLHEDDLIIDNFAGGGGASLGIEWALGRSPDIAVNHDPEAIAMHAANHPSTNHLCGSVWDVDPRKVCGGRPVALAWFSPDCTFHSKARGGKPFRERNPARRRRGLAWVVVRWAKAVKPRVIILENVEEFAAWGPLLADGRPCPERKGSTYRRWLTQLQNAGYVVEARELRACDYGAPTIRKRLFIVARCDGQPIVWPEPTHGPKVGQAYRAAAECIEWSIPCPSIFERERPLAENTLRRIARGIRRYVIEAPNPFIVTMQHQNRPVGIDEPLQTITTQGNKFNLVAPVIANLANADYPLRPGMRAHDIRDPLTTIHAGGGNHAIAAATLITKHYGGRVGSSIAEPLHTVTAESVHHSLTAATIMNRRNGERDGQAPRVRDIRDPHATVTGAGSQGGLVAAMLARHYGGHENDGAQLDLPIPTITAVDHHALVASHLLKLKGGVDDHPNTAQPMTDPMPTVCAGGLHVGEVRAFLLKYYGTDQDPQLCMPLGTVTTRDRFGLVTVEGEDYAIVDIGMRMLAPRELFRAQGFPDSYVIDPIVVRARHRKNGSGGAMPLTKTAQVRMCGNSVPPDVACALVLAQFAATSEAVA